MRAEASLVRAHGLAAVVTLLLSVGFGLTASIQLWWPDLGAGVPALSWGRIRYAHTQGIMLGWLANAFLAFLYFAVPRLTERPVTSVRLGWWLFGIWNLAVMVPGWTLVLAGVSQPLEWAEFPLIVDVMVCAGLGLAAAQFLPALFSRGLDALYVSSWYVIGALVFTLLAYPMGNIVPEFVPGAAGAAFSGLWIHDAVGLFVTPLALAILYYVIPAATGRPIYSHFLSILGFWLLFLLYPLNGTHHYVHSVIPMAAQFTAITASALLGVTVVIVVANLWLSLYGAGLFPRDPGLRFVVMAAVFYLIVSVQGSLQAFMTVNALVHFTDWVIGHSHLAMLGFASFAAAGGLVHAWQRTPGLVLHVPSINRAYWWLLAGVVLMVIDLSIVGLVQAQYWQSDAPWIDSVTASRHAWITRSATGLLVLIGFIELLRGLRSQPTAQDVVLEPAPRHGMSFSPYLLASIAGVGFFVLSIVILGVWPARVLDQQARALGPAVDIALTDSERRGRDVYAREGCAYCHTQQIRFTDADRARFGAPTLAWEGRRDYPHMLGTRRIGPDLSRAAGTRSADWHLAHLFDPRLVVRDSVMPPYRHLFDGDPGRPRQEALDVVAYLETLGRARALAGTDDDSLNRHPASTRRDGDVPDVPADGDADRGSRVYARHCASCHGPEGRGDGAAAGALTPRPPDLTGLYAHARIVEVLWRGVPGTSMPAWRDLPTADRADVSAFVRRLGVDRPVSAPASPDQAARLYADHCAQCHGVTGRGDGWAAHQLTVPPTNFHLQRGARTAEAIRDGIPGTMMAAWSMRLAPDEIDALVWYLSTLYIDEGRR